MARRHESRPTFWGGERNPGVLSWEAVEQRLRTAPAYWLTTVTADRRPVPRPVWGVWLDEQLWLSVGSVTHWHNVADGARSDVAVNLPSDSEVVIVQGLARPVSDAELLAPVVEVYNPKYNWNFTPETARPVLLIEPSKILAWTTVPAEEGTPDMDFPDEAGRWTF